MCVQRKFECNTAKRFWHIFSKTFLHFKGSAICFCLLFLSLSFEKQANMHGGSFIIWNLNYKMFIHSKSELASSYEISISLSIISISRKISSITSSSSLSSVWISSMFVSLMVTVSRFSNLLSSFKRCLKIWWLKCLVKRSMLNKGGVRSYDFTEMFNNHLKFAWNV